MQGWPWRCLSKSSQNSDIHLETHIRPNRRRLGLPWAPGRHHGARLLPHGLHHLHVQQRPPLACQGPRVKYLPPVCCLGPLNFFSSQDYQDLSHFSCKENPIFHAIVPNQNILQMLQVSLPVFLVLFSTGFVHVVAPQVIRFELMISSSNIELKCLIANV